MSNNILRSLQCNRFVGDTVKLWDSISVVSTWNQVWICWWSLVREIWTTCCTKPGQLSVDKLKLVELSFDALIWSNLVWDENQRNNPVNWAGHYSITSDKILRTEIFGPQQHLSVSESELTVILHSNAILRFDYQLMTILKWNVNFTISGVNSGAFSMDLPTGRTIRTLPLLELWHCVFC